jgi:hypothetical protein
MKLAVTLPLRLPLGRASIQGSATYLRRAYAQARHGLAEEHAQMSSQPQLRPEDIGVVVRALANRACSGRPIDSLDLTNEVDTVLGLVARTSSDDASADCLAAAGRYSCRTDHQAPWRNWKGCWPSGTGTSPEAGEGSRRAKDIGPRSNILSAANSDSLDPVK